MHIKGLVHASLIEANSSHFIYNRECANHQADDERETEDNELHSKTHGQTCHTSRLWTNAPQPCLQGFPHCEQSATNHIRMVRSEGTYGIP